MLKPQWPTHDTTRRWIASANTEGITNHVHNIERQNRSDRLRQLANSNQIRSESGKWIGSAQESQPIHHRENGQPHTSSRTVCSCGKRQALQLIS